MLGMAGWSYWLCNDVTYNCPANGCGNVPHQNCMAGEEDLAAVLAAGAILSLIAAAALLWPHRAGRAGLADHTT